ncbi:MAG: HRDC domain-containing protein [Elusimicrobia bacterium]|nr:HRDC domain-containing protein [Elusimicrobiota bacterium]
MSCPANEPPIYIETLEDLEAIAATLSTEKQVAVDMESDSFYVYHDKVCLLQLSSSTEDIVIDPLAVKDLSPLGPMFRDPSVEKIFHAGDYDIACLKRDYGFEVRNLFDTMAAARVLASPKLGLAGLIEKYFGVVLSKKLQRANWGLRPLGDDHIEYARNDTRYLHKLREILWGELEVKNLLRHAQDEFRRLEATPAAEKVFNPDAWWNLPGARDLDPRRRAVLKRLWIFREKQSASMDKAPFRVMPEDLLVRIAEARVQEVDDLRRVRGMSPYLFRRFGRELVAETSAADNDPALESAPERPRGERWDSESMRRYEALRAWRKDRAAAQGVDPVVILPTEDLRRLSAAPRENPDKEHWLDCLTAFKREEYGGELLGVLDRPGPAAPAGGKKRRRRGGRGRRRSGEGGVAAHDGGQPAQG